MQKQQKFNNKSLLSNIINGIRSKYRVVKRMVPLVDDIYNMLHHPLTMNNILSQGRVTKLASRVRLTQDFFKFILKVRDEYGSAETVKLLKASLVALQKALGDDRVISLIPLGAPHYYSKTSGGLPRFIPAPSRARIRLGDYKEIRFWTGLLNLYRVLEVPGNLKISTITDRFTGNNYDVEYYKLLVQDRIYFNRLRNFHNLSLIDLKPIKFVLSKASSPSNRVAQYGILTDIITFFSIIIICGLIL